LPEDPIVSFNRIIHPHHRGSDNFGHLQIKTQNGVVGSLSSSLMCNQVNTARVYGTQGMVIIENYWKSTQLTWITNEDEIKTLSFDDPTDFAPYIDHAVECIKKGLIESPIYNKKHWYEQVRLITSK
jgi:predicted dehydrogenase